MKSENLKLLKLLKKVPLLWGIKCKCAKGHVWQTAVGGVWLVMPWCPDCEEKLHKRLPAVSWIGIWSNLSDK